MPEVKKSLEELGHSYTYSMPSGKRMHAIIISCAREEYGRLKKAACDVPVAKRTAAVREAMRGWLDKTDGAASPNEK